MDTHKEAARAAIAAERARRTYQVVVSEVRRAQSIAQVPLPRTLVAYVALTTCTVKHTHGVPCAWVDWAFLQPGGAWRVVLQNDFNRPGMLLQESVRQVIDELVAGGRS